MEFADAHPFGTLFVLNPKTHKINLMNDVTFLGESYGEWDKVEKPAFIQVSDKGLDNQDEKPIS